MSTPLISVLLSVYNGERFLREAVESILKQTFREFELIVIDDGSTDASGKILEEYAAADNRIHLYPQANRGLVASLNRGAALSRGDYLARMDADDVALPDRFEQQVAFLDSNPAVAVLGGAAQLIDEGGHALAVAQSPLLTEELIHSRQTAGPVSHREISAALLDRNVLWHPTVLMRRASFEAIGGYRQVAAAEDYDLWLRMAEHFQLANLSTVVLQYRLHGAQITKERNLQMSLSGLTARAAAFARRSGAPDPIDSGAAISVAMLAGLIRDTRPAPSEARQFDSPSAEESHYKSYFRWLLQAAADMGPVCADSAISALQPMHWRQASRRQKAEAHYAAARLYLVRRQYPQVFVESCKAVWGSPGGISARLLKSLKSGLRRQECEA